MKIRFFLSVLGVTLVLSGMASESFAAACSPNGTIRAPQACNWGQIGMVRQTCTSGVWQTTSNTCGIINCGGGTIGVTRAGAACSGNYAGTTTETCTMDGTWKVTSNKCLPIIKTGACTPGVTADVDFGCPPGETGENKQRCVAANKWAPIGDTCRVVTCAGERVGTARVIKGALCPVGRTGVMIEVCHTNGAWVKTTNHCATAMCDGEGNQDGNATWPFTAADGSTANGTCIAGYTGAPTRTCAAGVDAKGDAVGVWNATVTNPCTRRTCTSPSENATWINPYSKTASVKGLCTWPDYEGNPSRDCDLAGSGEGWSAPSRSPCKASALPVKASLKLWFDAADISTLYSDSACATAIKENGTVGCWKDKSGGGRDATQGTGAQKPSYKINVQNKKPALYFNGSNWLETASFSWADDKATAFIVANVTGGGPPYLLTGTNNATLDFQTAQAQIYIPNGTVGVWSMSSTFGIYEVIRKDANSSTFVNGTSAGTNNNALAGLPTGIFSIGTRALDHAVPLVGNIAELVIYEKALSPGDRQDVEGYLASKWGIIIAPPYTTGMTLWLDGADGANIFTNSDCATGGNPASGSAVGCWKDKSGSGSGTNFITGNAPTYYTGKSSTGRSAITFNGSSNYLVAADSTKYDFSGSGGLATYTFLAALKPNASHNGAIFSKWNMGIYGQYYLEINTSATGWLMERENAPWYTNGLSSATMTPNVVTGMYDGAGAIRLFVNGIYQSSAAIGAVATGATVPTIGGMYNAGNPYYYLNADMYEFMVYASALTASQRVTVETFLMRKWGITPPTPLTSSGLSLWLDANDTASAFTSNDCATGYVSNTSAVGCWQDKSRNSNNFVMGAAAPTYTTNAQNSRPVVTFNGSTQYLERAYTAGLNPADNTLMVVSSISGGAGTFRSPITSRNTSGGAGYGYILYANSNNLWDPWGGTGSAGTPWWSMPTSTTVGTTPVILAASFKNASQNIYVNGVLSATGTSTYSPNTAAVTRVGAGATETTPAYYFYHNGNIEEILLYSRTLGVSERCAQEYYLANKWGTSLANSSCVAAFSANTVSGLALWLDASDAATVLTASNCAAGTPSSGGTVGCWTDKSGSGNHAKGGVAPTYTTNSMNGKSVITFTASKYLQTGTAGFPTGSTGRAAFVVVNTTTVAPSNQLLFGFGSSSATQYWGPFISTNKMGMDLHSYGPTGNTTTVAVNTNYIVSVIHPTGNAVTNFNMWINGVSQAVTNSNPGTIINTVIGTSYVGTPVWSVGSNGLAGQMAEILLYNRAITTAERQLIESVLGSKWGITLGATLPVTSGVQLWLDANDSTTTLITNCSGASATNGQSIGCWKDKSGQGLDVTVGGTAPTYATNAKNSKPVIVFGKNGYLQKTSITAGTLGSAGEISIFFVNITNSPMHKNSIINWEQSGNGNSRINIHDLYDDGFHFQFGSNVYNGVSKYSAGGSRDSWHVVSALKRTDNTMEVFMDGVSYASTTGATVALSTGSTGNLRIGSSLGNEYLDGRIAEVIVYSTALSSTDRISVERYLGAKWGITVP